MRASLSFLVLVTLPCACAYHGHSIVDINSLDFHPTAEYLISGGNDGRAVIWSARSTQPVEVIIPNPISAPSSRASTSSRAGGRPYPGQPVVFAGYVLDGSYICTVASDIVVYRAKDCSEYQRWTSPRPGEVACSGGTRGNITEYAGPAVDDGRRYLASVWASSGPGGFSTGQARLLIHTLPDLRLLGRREPVAVPLKLAFSPTSDVVALGSGPRIEILSLPSGQLPEAVLQPDRAFGQHDWPELCDLAFSRAGSLIASLHRDWTVRVWDYSTGKMLWSECVEDESVYCGKDAFIPWYGSVMFSRDQSKLLVSCGWSIRVFDAFSGDEVHRSELPSRGHREDMRFPMSLEAVMPAGDCVILVGAVSKREFAPLFMRMIDTAELHLFWYDYRVNCVLGESAAVPDGLDVFKMAPGLTQCAAAGGGPPTSRGTIRIWQNPRQ